MEKGNTRHELAKGTVVTLVPTGLGFLLSGPWVGILCLVVAGGLSLLLWTPVGHRFGLHDDNRPSVAAEIDNMIREGMELVSELSVPVQPEKTAKGWKIEGGGPSAGQQEKANAFRQRAFELIEQRNPILLLDYREGCNDYIHRPHDEIASSDPSTDKRSNAEKMLALASTERRTAAWEVEVCLEGLARAGKATS